MIAVYIPFAILQRNQIRAELERERITILAERVAAPFEAAVRIGLPLASVRNAEALLERARQLDSAIEAVVVLGPQGDVVRSVGNPEARVTAARFMHAATPEAGSHWFVESSQGYQSGLRLFDSTGRAAGAVAIQFSWQESRIASWAMAGQLIT